ncbi:hypothetical protein D8674_008540 [Pyrus ussuriensis x Pyrus communis]|uniref:Mitochondrial import inner membrane translocase subunit TIM50 n=1 Tax=Pyrus ussuriensis x Pyrus communis TaxID=2448454 RepID=A0A5N5HXQ0_9ROSA|nr:hypothetical protein D8674_008540 [Pyrus ussuriensis x Pyrus communis]
MAEKMKNKTKHCRKMWLLLEKLNLGPRKKLFVLSLGGLLWHRVHCDEASKIPKYRHPDAAYESFMVYKGPYCEGFMKFCPERFEVGIWSSARETGDCILGGVDQVECTDSGFKALEKKDNLPSRIAQYSSSNTLLIDDHHYKALLNPPNTAIFCTDYKVDQVNDMALGDESDLITGELRLYLDGLADADDVTSYVKEHPFGQPAITTKHSDWGFYSKIINHFQKD